MLAVLLTLNVNGRCAVNAEMSTAAVLLHVTLNAKGGCAINVTSFCDPTSEMRRGRD